MSTDVELKAIPVAARPISLRQAAMNALVVLSEQIGAGDLDEDAEFSTTVPGMSAGEVLVHLNAALAADPSNS